MKFTKRQIKVIEALQNGGWVWMSGSHAYLAVVDETGRIQSVPLHAKSFQSLKDEGVIVPDPAKEKQFILAV